MSTTTAPGPGDLTRVGDPQHFTPGCPACDGHHRTDACPEGGVDTTRHTETKDTMTIKRDLSDLPAAGPDGLAPDPSPRFVGVLVEAWANDRDDDKPTAHGTPFRHSDAGKCARALSYAALGIAKSDPMDLTGVFNVTLGTKLHDEWQAALLARYPDAEIEVKVRTVGADGSGHIDAVITASALCVDCHHGWGVHGDDGCTVARCRCTEPGDDVDHLDTGDVPIPVGGFTAAKVIAYELKTVGGFAFKAAVGAARKGTPAEGPKAAHLYQAALNGKAVDADEVVVGYLAKEAISVSAGARFGIVDPIQRISAEWTLTRDQYEPIAEMETTRVAAVLELVERGEVAPRRGVEMPPRAEVTEPTSGAWLAKDADGTLVETGSTWECGYCSWRTLCAGTLPGRRPVSEIRHAAKLLAEVDAEATPVTIGEVA